MLPAPAALTKNIMQRIPAEAAGPIVPAKIGALFLE